MEATEVANKVVDLLGQAAEKVGQTATTAFPYVVRYTWARGVAALVLASALLAVSTYAWVKVHQTLKFNIGKRYGETDEGTLWVGIPVAVLCLLIGLVIVGINLADVLEPTGATIMTLVHELRGRSN